MHPGVLLFPSPPPRQFQPTSVWFGAHHSLPAAVCCRGHSLGLQHDSLEAELIQHGCLSRQITGERPPMQNQESLDDIDCVPTKQEISNSSDTGSHFGSTAQPPNWFSTAQLSTTASQTSTEAAQWAGRQAGRQTHQNPRPHPSRCPPKRLERAGAVTGTLWIRDEYNDRSSEHSFLWLRILYLLGTLPNRID